MSGPCIYFYQKPFTVNSEQMGCYYFNILQAVEYCRLLNATIVPPLFPLCPRDNTMVEVYKSMHWENSILTIDSISSTEVLEYTIPTMHLDEFIQASSKRVNMNHLTLDINSIIFHQDIHSPYWILDMTPRWDLQGNAISFFYNKLYKTLPFKHINLSNIDIVRPCLGVHWRRGDRGNITMGHIGQRLWNSTEPDQVAKHINSYLEQDPTIKSVYISTNSGSKRDRSNLESLIHAPVYFLSRPNTNPLDHWKWDLTDLFLCSSATHILLSPGGLQHSSAFGRLIYAEALRKNPNVTVTSMPLL